MEPLQLTLTFYKSKRRAIQRTILKDLLQTCLPMRREGSASQILYWHQQSSDSLHAASFQPLLLFSSASKRNQPAPRNRCPFLQHLQKILGLGCTSHSWPLCLPSPSIYFPFASFLILACNGSNYLYHFEIQACSTVSGPGRLILSWLIN